MCKRSPRRATLEGPRVCSVLKGKNTREELVRLAACGEWNNVSVYNASREQIVDHLGKSVSLKSDASFLGLRCPNEAAVLLKSRPVLLVKNGTFDEAPLAGPEQRLKKHRAVLATPIRLVGRLESIDHDGMGWCGIGWRTEGDLIITSRRVVSLFAKCQGSLLRFRLSQADKQVRTRVGFCEEYRQPESGEHVTARVPRIIPDISEASDMATFQVVKGDLLPPPLILARQGAKPRQVVAVVGYPVRGSRNDAGVTGDVLGNVYDVKCFASGGAAGLPHDV